MVLAVARWVVRAVGRAAGSGRWWDRYLETARQGSAPERALGWVLVAVAVAAERARVQDQAQAQAAGQVWVQVQVTVTPQPVAVVSSRRAVDYQP